MKKKNTNEIHLRINNIIIASTDENVHFNVCSALIYLFHNQVIHTELNGDIEERKPKLKDKNHSWQSANRRKYHKNEVSCTRHKNTKTKRMLWKAIPKSDITPIQEECCELGADKANFNETVISADHFSDLTDRTPIIEEQCELGVADANYNETVSTMDNFSDHTNITPIKEKQYELGAAEVRYNERVNAVSDLSDKIEICCDEIDQLKCDCEAAIKQSLDRLNEAKTKTSPWKRVRVMIRNQKLASRKGTLNVTRRCPSIN